MARITPAFKFLGLLMAVIGGGDGIASAATPASSNGLPELGEKYVEELKDPIYAASRCMLSPVFSSDRMTVAVSVDRVFSAGDLVEMVGGEQLDTSAKFPLRDLLMKHGPNEVVQVKVRRANNELTVAAQCTDSKPLNDLLLEAAFAASKNDPATCTDKLDAAARLHALAHGSRVMAYQCRYNAKRFLNQADNTKAGYELARELILENAWSSDALSNIRGSILSTVDLLQKNNASLFADDLRQQYDQAVTTKLSHTTAATAGPQ